MRVILDVKLIRHEKFSIFCFTLLLLRFPPLSQQLQENQVMLSGCLADETCWGMSAVDAHEGSRAYCAKRKHISTGRLRFAYTIARGWQVESTHSIWCRGSEEFEWIRYLSLKLLRSPIFTFNLCTMYMWMAMDWDRLADRYWQEGKCRYSQDITN